MPTKLIFSRPPVPAGPVRLVFGDDGAVAPVLATTAQVVGQLSGLRGAVHLRRANPAQVEGRLSGLRGHLRVLTVPVAQVAGKLSGLRGRLQVFEGTQAQVQGRLSGLRGMVRVSRCVQGQVQGKLSGLRGAVAASYNVNVPRPTVGLAQARYQQAQPVQAGVVGHYQQSLPAATGARAHWQDAQKVQHLLRGAWQEAQRLETWARPAYQQALRLPVAPTRSAWQEAERVRSGAGARFQEAQRLPALPLGQRFQEALHLRSGGVQRFQEARRLSAGIVHWAGYGLPVRVALGGCYQEAWPPRPGQWTPTVVPPGGGGPCYSPTLPARLVFSDVADSTLPARLIFKCDNASPGPGPEPGATVVVPIRRIYMTLNDIKLTRADTGEPIPTYTFGMSIDVDSWTWQWSASLHHAALPLIVPGSSGDPVEVLASINGTPYRLAVENYSRNRSFGQTRIAVTGRGRAAILDAPYAPTLNHASAAARTARQLMQDALTINGVGIGWDIDWRLTDWLVPADTWVHQGSYISAILDIAGAAGGYVQSHNTAPTLCILPRYPAAPWHWGTLTPDFELPSAVVSVEGIEWQRKAPYDRVYVSGTTADGVLGQVTRAGRAGGSVAPMVTHPLITNADAARQRGIAELGDTGRQAHINLKLPVLQETGVIQPGALVRYVDGGETHLGLVRGTSVDWSRPTLRQTLSVETHPA